MEGAGDRVESFFVFLFIFLIFTYATLFSPSSFLCCLLNLIQVYKQHTITNQQEYKVSLLCFIFLLSLTAQLSCLFHLPPFVLFQLIVWVRAAGLPRERRPRRKAGAVIARAEGESFVREHIWSAGLVRKNVCVSTSGQPASSSGTRTSGQPASSFNANTSGQPSSSSGTRLRRLDPAQG